MKNLFSITVNISTCAVVFTNDPSRKFFAEEDCCHRLTIIAEACGELGNSSGPGLCVCVCVSRACRFKLLFPFVLSQITEEKIRLDESFEY